MSSWHLVYHRSLLGHAEGCANTASSRIAGFVSEDIANNPTANELQLKEKRSVTIGNASATNAATPLTE